MNQNGSISFVIYFVVLAFITLTLFVFLFPLVMNLNTAFALAGEPLLAQQSELAAGIEDATVKAQVESMIVSEKGVLPQITEILAFFFQYAWILIIFICIMALYIYTRNSVEAETYRAGIS